MKAPLNHVALLPWHGVLTLCCYPVLVGDYLEGDAKDHHDYVPSLKIGDLGMALDMTPELLRDRYVQGPDVMLSVFAPANVLKRLSVV